MEMRLWLKSPETFRSRRSFSSAAEYLGTPNMAVDWLWVNGNERERGDVQGVPVAKVGTTESRIPSFFHCERA
jgi:hypothetical protein